MVRCTLRLRQDHRALCLQTAVDGGVHASLGSSRAARLKLLR